MKRYVLYFIKPRLPSLCQNGIFAVEWVRPSDPAQAADLICVYWGPKYKVPGSTGTRAKRPRAAKSVKEGKTTSRIIVEKLVSTETGAEAEANIPIPIPTGEPATI